MRDLISKLAENWEVVSAIVTAISGVIAFFLSRQRELAWRRAEFLFEQSRYLDTDPDLTEAITILEGRHTGVTALQIFDPDSELKFEEQLRYLQKMEKLLNFLWRLCYAYLTVKVLSKKEIEAFSWYLWTIAQQPLAMDYCKVYGYEEISLTIQRLGLRQEDDYVYFPPRNRLSLSD